MTFAKIRTTTRSSMNSSARTSRFACCYFVKGIRKLVLEFEYALNLWSQPLAAI